MIDITPFPGELLPQEVAKPILDQFLAIYRVRTEGRPPYIPTWCTFPMKGILTDETILTDPSFLKYDALYFYFENAKTLYLATPQQILEYFSNRNPWENKDYYVFDFHFDWCIALTHEDDVIFVGEFAL